MISMEEFERLLRASVASGKITQAHASEELERRRQWMLGQADAPSFLQKAKNFAKAAVSHIAAGAPLAPGEEIDRRLAICKQCPFLKDNACTKCGCPVVRERKFISKLAWADQKCPDGRW